VCANSKLFRRGPSLIWTGSKHCRAEEAVRDPLAIRAIVAAIESVVSSPLCDALVSGTWRRCDGADQRLEIAHDPDKQCASAQTVR